MPRAAITVNQVSRHTAYVATADVGAAANVADGNVVANKGLMWLEVHNDGASARILTVNIKAGAVDGQAVTPKSHSIAAAAKVKIGPFPVDTYSGDLEINGAHAELKILAYALVP